MKVQFAMCIFLQVLFVKTEAFTGNTANQTHAELEYLGFANGKNYFVYALDLTWDDARIVCREFSMDLASIRTDGQLEFLKTVYSKLVGHEYLFQEHWIGARDAESPRSLSYLDTGGEVPTFEETSWVYKASSYQVCGAYNPNSDYEAPTPVPELVIFPCMYERPALCSA